MKFWIKAIATGALVIFWLFFIGSFSAQTGGESTGVSDKVVRCLISIEESILQKDFTDQEIQKQVDLLTVPVRKLAHMTEYGLLAVFLLWHLTCYFKSDRDKYRFLLAWILATLYAATDEIHQLYVPGRSGEIRDVCIDAVGAALGVFLYILIRKIGRKIRKG